MADNFYSKYPPTGGVSAVNTLTGSVTLAAGTNITLTPVGNTITIDAAGGGGGGANVTLSNLTTTAINAALIFASGVTANFSTVDAPTDLVPSDTFNFTTGAQNAPTSSQVSGSFLFNAGDNYGTGTTGGFQFDGGYQGAVGGTGAITLQTGYAENTGSTTTGFVQILTGDCTAGKSGLMLLGTGNPGGTGHGFVYSIGANSGGNLFLVTGGPGNASTLTNATTADSGGNIILHTGLPVNAGVRGNIALQNGTEGTIGDVWTSTDTLGNGSWQTPGGGGAVPAFLTATSSIKTPTATDNYSQMTGNSVVLTAGSWQITGSCFFGGNGAPAYTGMLVGWFAANGNDTSTPPTALSGAIIDAGYFQSEMLAAASATLNSVTLQANIMRLTVGSNTTIYLVPLGEGTAANIRMTTRIYAQKL